jgi:hypothetical protein
MREGEVAYSRKAVEKQRKDKKKLVVNEGCVEEK